MSEQSDERLVLLELSGVVNVRVEVIGPSEEYVWASQDDGTMEVEFVLDGDLTWRPREVLLPEDLIDWLEALEDLDAGYGAQFLDSDRGGTLKIRPKQPGLVLVDVSEWRSRAVGVTFEAAFPADWVAQQRRRVDAFLGAYPVSLDETGAPFWSS